MNNEHHLSSLLLCNFKSRIEEKVHFWNKQKLAIHTRFNFSDKNFIFCVFRDAFSVGAKNLSKEVWLLGILHVRKAKYSLLYIRSVSDTFWKPQREDCFLGYWHFYFQRSISQKKIHNWWSVRWYFKQLVFDKLVAVKKLLAIAFVLRKKCIWVTSINGQM